MRAAWLLSVALTGLAIGQELPEPETWKDDRAFPERELNPERIVLEEADAVVLAALVGGGERVLLVTRGRMALRVLEGGAVLAERPLRLTRRATAAIDAARSTIAIDDGPSGLRAWRVLEREPWFERTAEAGTIRAGPPDDRVTARGRLIQVQGDPWARDPLRCLPVFRVAQGPGCVDRDRWGDGRLASVGPGRAVFSRALWRFDASSGVIQREGWRELLHSCIAISEDWAVVSSGRGLAIGRPKRSPRDWGGVTREVDGPVSAAAISPDGRWVMAGSQGCLWLFADSRDGPFAPADRLQVADDEIAVVRAFGGGAWVLTRTGTLLRVEVASDPQGSSLRPGASRAGPADAVDVHPDGGLALVRSPDGGIVPWQLGPQPAALARSLDLDNARFAGGPWVLGTRPPTCVRRLATHRLPVEPRTVVVGRDYLDWRWTTHAPRERPRLRARLAAPQPGALDLTVEHVGGDGAFLLRGLLRAAPNAEPVWVALGTLEPGKTLTRHLAGAAPAPEATLELADQWGRLTPLAVELGR